MYPQMNADYANYQERGMGDVDPRKGWPAGRSFGRRGRRLVGDKGLEPSTPTMSRQENQF